MREEILAKIEEGSLEERFTPRRIVHEVRRVMPVDGILALDNGMYKIWFARNYRTTRANTVLRSTMRWRRWGRVCPRRSGRSSRIPSAGSWRSAATAGS